MCDDSKTPLQRVIAGLTTSGASGVAKASPGVAVTGLTIAGYSIETWVSVLTAMYLIAMFIGACPKMVEGLRYLYRLVFPPKPLLEFNQKPCDDVKNKIEKAKK